MTELLKNDKRTLPQILWIYWATGLATAPMLVKRCVQSWRDKNPEWDIRLIDNENLSDYQSGIDIPDPIFAKLPIQKKANLIRIKLLIDHGGVWADATCFCLQPLSQWIQNATRSGAFMFYKPGRDRLISNWFIAAEPANYLIQALYEERCAYWTAHDFPHSHYFQKKWMPQLCRLINRNVRWPQFWFHSFFTKILRIYPYLIFHYGFYRVLQQDSRAAAIWEQTPKISAVEPHFVQRMGMLSEVTEEQKLALTETEVPLLKLSHKYDQSRYHQRTLLHYLFSKF